MRAAVGARWVMVAGVLGAAVAGCAQWLKTQEMAVPPPPQAVTTVPGTSAIYDADPNHLWNRLYAALCVRQLESRDLGVDRLDPLLWANTQRLFKGPAHERAIRVLDEFIAGHGEELVREPLKRAMMQRDLWAVLDWAGIAAERRESVAAKPEAAELRKRLLTALIATRLTAREIAGLPDNYAAAARSGVYAADYDRAHGDRYFVPADLMDPKGAWVCIATKPYSLMAPKHAEDFGYRSVLTVFLRLPGGRAAALDYLTAFRGAMPAIPEGAAANGVFDRMPVGEGPKLPLGAAVALVRQAVLLDETGAMVASHLTESVQFRVNRERRPEDTQAMAPQDVYELELRRAKLFAGETGGLHAREPEEKDFPFVQFQSQGIDEMEGFVRSYPERKLPPIGEAVVLQSCISCHSPQGRFSILSLQKGEGRLGPGDIRLGPEREANEMGQQAFVTVNEKKKQYSWGFLEGGFAPLRH